MIQQELDLGDFHTTYNINLDNDDDHLRYLIVDLINAAVEAVYVPDTGGYEHTDDGCGPSVEDVYEQLEAVIFQLIYHVTGSTIERHNVRSLHDLPRFEIDVEEK